MDPEVDHLLQVLQGRAKDGSSERIRDQAQRIQASYAAKGMRGGMVHREVDEMVRSEVKSELLRLMEEFPETLRRIYGVIPNEVLPELVSRLDSIVDGKIDAWKSGVAELIAGRPKPSPLADGWERLRIDMKRELKIRFGADAIRARIRMGPKAETSKQEEPAFDVFLSHASEDKPFVEELSKELERRGVTVWLDKGEITVGDGIFSSIDSGLRRSRFGVVVLSPAYFAKGWTLLELNALAAEAASSQIKKILPVWHQLTRDEVARHSPLLAAVLGVASESGLDGVADALVRGMGLSKGRSVDQASATEGQKVPGSSN